MEEVRRLQVRLEEQEERNKTLREVNAELRRQLQRRDESGTAVDRPIPAGAGKKVSARLMVFIHVTVASRFLTSLSHSAIFSHNLGIE